MNYYIIEAGDQSLAQMITTEDGKSLGAYQGVGVDQQFCEVERCVIHVPFLDSDRDIENPASLRDVIGVNNDIAISTRFAKVLEKFKTDSRIKTLSVDVRNRAGQVLSSTFTFI